ncbi:MAG: AraC family transcriptional regulator [Ruminococcaceae bacterium]|nr:AraC family transcriptional regulator [Oscillospiraceae bacterium]
MTESIIKFVNDKFVFEHKIDKFPSFEALPHTHGDFEIYYLILGNCDYYVEKTTHHLKQGDILIIRPSELHGINPVSSDVPYERVVINVKGEFINEIDKSGQLMESLNNVPFGTLNRFDAETFGHNLCTDALDSLIENSDEITELDIIPRIFLVLSEIKRVLKKTNTGSLKKSTADKIFDFVNQNLFSDITLQKISDTFFISQSQINRIFKKHTGVSVGKYIATKRLLGARHKLHSGVPAIKVSEECGYTDYSVFYRAYKNQFGCSPQQERKKQ